MKIELIEWVSSFLMPTKNIKIARYCAVISSTGVNYGSLVVTRDPRDPSKNSDPFAPWPTDPFPSLWPWGALQRRKVDLTASKTNVQLSKSQSDVCTDRSVVEIAGIFLSHLKFWMLEDLCRWRKKITRMRQSDPKIDDLGWPWTRRRMAAIVFKYLN